MRILVTGGAGFIGSHLVDALVARGHQVTVVDDLSTGRRTNLPPAADLIRADIGSPRMKDVFRDVRPAAVFHLAAQKNVRLSLDQPVVDAAVNVGGSLNILDCARQFGVRKFIFSSTGGALYGDGVKRPTPETVPPRPESPYGIAKFTIEQYLDFYQRRFGLRGISLRYANVYGPRQDPEGEAGVIAVFAKRILRREPLWINGSGAQTRDYVYVSDVVEANLAALNRQVTGAFNIGTARQTTVNRLAQRLVQLSGRRVAVKHRRGIPGEVQRSVLDWRLAKRRLKWQPVVTLSDGLARTWNWAKGGIV